MLLHGFPDSTSCGFDNVPPFSGKCDVTSARTCSLRTLSSCYCFKHLTSHLEHIMFYFFNNRAPQTMFQNNTLKHFVQTQSHFTESHFKNCSPFCGSFSQTLTIRFHEKAQHCLSNHPLPRI